MVSGGDGWQQRVSNSHEKMLECACDCCDEAALAVAAVNGTPL